MESSGVAGSRCLVYVFLMKRGLHLEPLIVCDENETEYA